MNKKGNLLIIFAKDPVAGRVKNRLAKEIGKSEALKIYEILLQKTLGIFKKSQHDVQLYFAPAKTRLKKITPNKFKLKPQKGRNLGKRMLNAFRDNTHKYESVIIIGVDCPFINISLIRKAFRALKSNPIVIGPSRDGGYYLIGMSKLFPSIFKNISWGSNKVLKQTLRQCKLLGIKPYLTKWLYDIDTIYHLKKWKGKK